MDKVKEIKEMLIYISFYWHDELRSTRNPNVDLTGVRTHDPQII